jgi:23S rRNA pseudouridine2605 synthase
MTPYDLPDGQLDAELAPPPPGEDRPDRPGTESGGARSTADDGLDPWEGEPDGPDESEPAEPLRLHKVLAQAGVASRRASEEMIAAGRVEVDGVVVTEMGSRIDPDRAVVHVDGVRIPLGNRNRVHSYVVVHKPRGVVSSMWDEQGRPDIPSLLPVKLARRTRFFHVGRLDQDTEGLLLLTDDGELTHRLTHPSFGVSKTYVAEVPGPVDRETVLAVRAGVEVDGRTVEIERFRVVTATKNRALVEITVHEGRKHVVRDLLEAAGLPVKRLVRIKFGPIALGNLPPGEYRELDRTEVGKLYDLVGL